MSKGLEISDLQDPMGRMQRMVRHGGENMEFKEEELNKLFHERDFARKIRKMKFDRMVWYKNEQGKYDRLVYYKVE